MPLHIHIRRLALALLTLITALTATAQPQCADSCRWQVSWITVTPGREVYELEGHTGLRLTNGHVDVVMNWGVFDFAAPAFVWRFALGQTDYMVEPAPTRPFVDYYTAQGRRVIEQRLNLSAHQAQALAAIADSLMRPGCNTYRYNYVLDNCSTRPLTYVERAAGSPVILPEGADSLTGATFRSEMRRYHRDYPWYQFGIDLALGSLIDRPLRSRELGFAPVEMSNILSRATIPGPDGSLMPLAQAPVLLNPESRQLPPIEAPWWPTPAALSWLLLGCIMLSVVIDWRRGAPARWVDSALFGTYGLMGCVVAFLVVLSEHYATTPNWNILWLNPMLLFLAVCVWLPARRRQWLRWIFGLNLLGILAAAVIYICGVQAANAAFWPLMGCSALRSAIHISLWHKNSK